MHQIAAGLIGLCLIVGAPEVGAQAYPNKPIRLVLPFPPGGGTDTFGRITADRMTERLGQQVIITNIAGGSGTVGSDTVRRAEPDGYTLLFHASLFALGKHVLKSTPYDPIEDFTAIGRVGIAPLLVVASNQLEGTTLADAVKAARANPKGFNIAIPSLGAAGHLGTLEFRRVTKLDLQVIPYKGTAPGLADVMGGSVQMMIDAMTALLPQAKAGRVKGLAVTSPTRTKLAPDIPTTAEAGMPELDINSWYGVWGPKGLPPAITSRLVAAVAEAVKHPEFLQRIEAAGILPGYLEPAEFVTFMRADVDKAVGLLKGANFTPE